MKPISLKFCLLLLPVLFLSLTWIGNSIAQQDVVSAVEMPQGNSEKFTYSPMGRRDPFKPLIEKKEKIVEKINARPEKLKGPLEKFELGQFRLMAIMIVKGSPRAMVKAPDGKSYTVKINDYIGMNDGIVKKIETKVVEVDKNGMRIEKSPDRIVVEELGVDGSTGKQIKENRYIVM